MSKFNFDHSLFDYLGKENKDGMEAGYKKLGELPLGLDESEVKNLEDADCDYDDDKGEY